MLIRRAEKRDVKGAIPLLLMALDEMTEVYSGYNDKEKAIAKYEEFFLLEEGRYSYKNFIVCEVDKNVAGIVVSYYSNDRKKLDTVLIKNLKSLGIDRKEFEQEFNENEYYVDSVAVSPDYQGRGIAKKLIEAAEARGRSMGYKTMSLIVHEGKEIARSIYEKIGYENDENIVVYGEKYYHMVKKL